MLMHVMTGSNEGVLMGFVFIGIWGNNWASLMMLLLTLFLMLLVDVVRKKGAERSVVVVAATVVVVACARSVLSPVLMLVWGWVRASPSP